MLAYLGIFVIKRMEIQEEAKSEVLNLDAARDRVIHRPGAAAGWKRSGDRAAVAVHKET